MATYNISVLATSSSGSGYRFSGTDKNGTISSSTNNPTINITVGDTINFTFSNTTSHPFTITGTTIDGESATAGDYSTPTSESYTFSSTMTYTYFCEVHGSMTGSIIASAASATTTTTTAAPTTTTTTTLAPSATTTTTTTTTSAPSATTTTTTTTTAPSAATTTTTTTAAPDGTAATTTTTTTSSPSETTTTTTTNAPFIPDTINPALPNDWQIFNMNSIASTGFPSEFFHFFKRIVGLDNLLISDVEFEYKKEGETIWSTKYFHYKDAAYVQLPSENLSEKNKPASIEGILHSIGRATAKRSISSGGISFYEFSSLYTSAGSPTRHDDRDVKILSNGKFLVQVLDMPNWVGEFNPVFYKSKIVNLKAYIGGDESYYRDVEGALRDPADDNTLSTDHRYGRIQSGRIGPLIIDIPDDDHGGLSNITHLETRVTGTSQTNDSIFGSISFGSTLHNSKLRFGITGQYASVSWNVPEDKQIIFDYSNSRYWSRRGIGDERNGFTNNDTYDLWGYEIEVKKEGESEWKDWIVLDPSTRLSDLGELWGEGDTGGDETPTCLKGRDGKEYESGSRITIWLGNNPYGNMQKPRSDLFAAASDADIASNPYKYQQEIGQAKFKKSYLYYPRIRAVYKCDFFEGSMSGGSILPDGSVVGLPIATPTFCTSDWTESTSALQMTHGDYRVYGEAVAANYDSESQLSLNNAAEPDYVNVSSILGPSSSE